MTKKTPIINIEKIKNLQGIKHRDFIEIYEKDIQPILISLENKNNPIRIHLKYYLIIRLVSMIEHNLKNLAVKLIDTQNLQTSKLFSKGEVMIPLSKLDDIKESEFTRGKIVASNFNFQNLKDINFVFTQLHEVSYFDALKDYILLRNKKDP